MSHPSRVRGLKCQCILPYHLNQKVAPFTGAWIEICVIYPFCYINIVAPFTGAWIEIAYSLARITFCAMSHPSRVRGLKFQTYYLLSFALLLSHPSRVRGLKFSSVARKTARSWVAPFTGAWIEIPLPFLTRFLPTGRTLHGCVDWNPSRENEHTLQR
mgnify:CR=1 FL=1